MMDAPILELLVPPPPIRFYAYGVIVGEVCQWGKWLTSHQDRKSMFDYWRVGWPHFLSNLVIIFGVGALWSMPLPDGTNLLDAAIGFVVKHAGGADWAMTGVPYTPPMGLILGAVADVGGDMVAFVLGKVLGSLPFLSRPEPPPATPPPLRSTGGES